MKVQVYKCRFTGKLFESKDRVKYIKHLKDLRVSMKEEREFNRIRNDFAAWLKKEKKKITLVEMIVPWILENQKYLMKAYNAIHPTSWDKWYPKTDEITEIVLDVKYDKHVSNSHSRPHNGVTNWCAQDKTKPTSYPGFKGRVDGKTQRAKKNMSSYPTSDLLEFIGIMTGTGGGGNENWGWDTKLFLADWPGLKHEVDLIERDEIVARLKGTK